MSFDRPDSVISIEEEEIFPFAGLPIEIKTRILGQLLSFEMPHFLRDLWNLRLVCKEFRDICDVFLKRQILGVPEIKEQYLAAIDHYCKEKLDFCNDLPANKLFRLKEIRAEITGSREKISQGIRRRNYFFGTSHGSYTYNIGMYCFICILAAVVIIFYMNNRHNNCYERLIDKEEYEDCLLYPLINVLEDFFELNHTAAKICSIAALPILVLITPLFLIALERLILLNRDAVKLIFLKCQEKLELQRLTKPEVCQYFKRFLSIVKWRERMAVVENDLAVLKTVQESKQQVWYRLMEELVRLSEKRQRLEEGNPFLTWRSYEVGEGDELNEEPEAKETEGLLKKGCRP